MFNLRLAHITLSFIFTLVTLTAFLLPVGAEENQKPIQLDKIVVTPGKFTIYEGTTPQISISKTEIEQFPLIDNDIMRSGHIFPGVTASDFSARFSVRSGEKDGVAVRLDGIELYNPYHLQDFGGAISIVGLGLIQRADLLMGGFPAEYGQKMSGVFDLTSKEPNREKVSANFGLDLINATAQIEGPLTDRGGWILSARRGYIDLILALADIDDRYKPQYSDVYGKFKLQLTDADTLTLNGLYGWDYNLVRADDVSNSLESNYDNLTTWLNWRHIFGTNHWTDVYLYGGSSGQEKEAGVADFDNRDFLYYGTKVELTSNVHDQHTIRSGVEWRWSDAKYDYFAKERIAGINNYDEIDVNINQSGNDIKFFLQDEWQIHAKLALNVGGRFIYQDSLLDGVSNYEIGPRVALAFQANDNLILRGAWGIYHQPIDLVSLPVEDGITTAGSAEQSIHYILGFEYSATNNLLIKLEGYYKHYDNLVGRLREFGRQTQVFTPLDTADVKGFDLFTTHAVSNRLSWSLGYAFGIAEEETGGRTIYRESDRRHSIYLNSNYQFAPSWLLYVSWRFNTGTPRTPLIHEKVESNCNRQFGEPHAERLPPYHSLDFRITKRSIYKRWSLSWYFQILNLYNRSNIDQYAFSEIRDEDTNQLIDCSVESEPLLPIVPTLGITLTF